MDDPLAVATKLCRVYSGGDRVRCHRRAVQAPVRLLFANQIVTFGILWQDCRARMVASQGKET